MPEYSLNRKWFAIYTKPRQESVAEFHLARQGFEVYLPRVEIRRRSRGAIQSLVDAYFPRYLFTRFDPERDDWSPIHSTRGVTSLVKILGRPRSVPSELIEALQGNEDGNRCQRTQKKTWQAGDVVEIEQGPFSGYRCIFQEHRSANRVAVLLNLIGKPTVTTLNAQDLRLEPTS